MWLSKCSAHSKKESHWGQENLFLLWKLGLLVVMAITLGLLLGGRTVRLFSLLSTSSSGSDSDKSGSSTTGLGSKVRMGRSKVVEVMG